MDKHKHRNTVEFKVSGAYALFTDVLTRTGGERCTYMIPTYEALKGMRQENGNPSPTSIHPKSEIPAIRRS